eukprot:scaffold152850_cov20-Tisochrysis_lutea.AAC.1
MGIKNWKGEINKARHKQYFWCNTCFEGYSRNMTKGRDALAHEGSDRTLPNASNTPEFTPWLISNYRMTLTATQACSHTCPFFSLTSANPRAALLSPCWYTPLTRMLGLAASP